MRKMFVLSSPSGGGKTTIRNYLLKKCPLLYSISYTTRPPRQEEKDQRDYFFVSMESFKEKIEKKEFIEWTKVLNHYYGTSRKFLEEILKKGKDILLEIDIEGAKQVKKEYGKQVVTIFISPPSFEELKKRLKDRKTENEENISKRLSLARKEMQEINNYDYLVVNKNLKKCLKDIKEIIKTEGVLRSNANYQ